MVCTEVAKLAFAFWVIQRVYLIPRVPHNHSKLIENISDILLDWWPKGTE